MDTNLEFQKAILLLDHGKLENGVEKLKNVIVQSEAEGDTVTLVKSLVCLGDFLVEQGLFRDAKPLLSRALTYKRNDDILTYEFERAIELLATEFEADLAKFNSELSSGKTFPKK